jgi:hypothetical protein
LNVESSNVLVKHLVFLLIDSRGPMFKDSFPVKGPVSTQPVDADPSPPNDSKTGELNNEPLDAGLSMVQSQYGCAPV